VRTRSTSTTPPVAGTGNITVAARDDGGARSLWASALTAGGSAAKVSGQTKTEVKDKLQLLHDELREGVRSSPKYTVQNAVEDWLAQALDGRAAKTISTNREVLEPLTALIGAARLRELTAAEVRSALAQLATTRSARAVQMTRNSLVRAIRYAEANDLVGRNVAELVSPPRGLEGRSSRSLTLQQAQALVKAAEGSGLHAYIVLAC